MATSSLARWMLLGLGGGAVLAGAYLFAPDLRRALMVPAYTVVEGGPPEPSPPPADLAPGSGVGQSALPAAERSAARAVQPSVEGSESPAAPAASSSAAAVMTTGGPASGAMAPSAPASGAGAAARVSPQPSHDPPRFDVVRVGARGVAVVAGRASPGAEVVLVLDGAQEIGRARADARGEWVILPAEPLAPGTRELSLRARLAGEETAGPDTVVVLVPEAARGGAVADASASRQAQQPLPQAAARQQEGGAAPGPATTPFAVLLPPPAPLDAAPEASAAGPSVAAGLPRVLQAPPPNESGAARPAAIASAAQSGAVPRGAGGASASAPRLALEVVDYDDSGAMRFAGTAPPGTAVRIYVDQRHVGDARADAAGRWAFMPGEPPSYGLHTLRIDQIAAAGSVAARIELPFQRDRIPAASATAAMPRGEAAEARTAPPDVGTATPPGREGGADAAAVPHAGGRVVVQPGHNLWRIARATYGHGVRYTVIYQANRDQIRDPDLIYPGQIFALPETGPETRGPTSSVQLAPAESSRSR